LRPHGALALKKKGGKRQREEERERESAATDVVTQKTSTQHDRSKKERKTERSRAW
jgi:hypothetical protein